MIILTLVGYKRMTIQVLDDDFKPVTASKFVIEGNPDEGATNKFEITGLSKAAIKTYGSNIPYLISQKGTGDVKANFGILDLPFASEQTVLGRKTSTDGVTHIGEETNPPYCAVLMESEDLRGEPIGFGIYIGKFGRDAITAETLTEGDFQPTPDDYTFVPISKKIEKVNQTVGIASTEAGLTALKTELFGIPAGG